MTSLPVFRQAMMNWNRFVTACILAAALLLKFGVPLQAILLGLAGAAVLNWQLRPRVTPSTIRPPRVRDRRQASRSDV